MLEKVEDASNEKKTDAQRKRLLDEVTKSGTDTSVQPKLPAYVNKMKKSQVRVSQGHGLSVLQYSVSAHCMPKLHCLCLGSTKVVCV